MEKRMIAKNPTAYHNYEILDKYENIIFCNFIRKYVLFLVNPCRKSVRGV